MVWWHGYRGSRWCYGHFRDVSASPYFLPRYFLFLTCIRVFVLYLRKGALLLSQNEKPGYQVDKVASQKWEVIQQIKYFADIGSITKVSVFQSALLWEWFLFCSNFGRLMCYFTSKVGSYLVSLQDFKLSWFSDFVRVFKIIKSGSASWSISTVCLPAFKFISNTKAGY